jgi:hypothetical protein
VLEYEQSDVVGARIATPFGGVARVVHDRAEAKEHRYVERACVGCSQPGHRHLGAARIGTRDCVAASAATTSGTRLVADVWATQTEATGRSIDTEVNELAAPTGRSSLIAYTPVPPGGKRT